MHIPRSSPFPSSSTRCDLEIIAATTYLELLRPSILDITLAEDASHACLRRVADRDLADRLIVIRRDTDLIAQEVLGVELLVPTARSGRSLKASDLHASCQRAARPTLGLRRALPKPEPPQIGQQQATSASPFAYCSNSPACSRSLSCVVVRAQSPWPLQVGYMSPPVYSSVVGTARISCVR